VFGQPVQININKISQKINFQKFGNCYYFSLKNLADLLISDSDIIINNCSINCRNEILKFSPNSFFVVYKNDSILRVAQMAQPSVDYNENLFIPVISFFNAMNGINLINCNINDNQIEIISTFIFKKIMLFNVENYFLSSKDKKIIIENNSPLLLIKNELSLIENSIITKIDIKPRRFVKKYETKKSDTKISIFSNNSKLIDSTKNENQNKDLFLYDTKKDEINPKTYTIPKDLRKPK
jgi:hypothetical protein